MSNAIDFAVVDGIVARHGAEASNVIAILQDIQAQYRYLPREVFPYLARKLQMSAAKIYSVATFYENFSLEPKGKYVIKICDGTACHVRKSVPILEKMRETLGLSAQKLTTDDMMFTVETGTVNDKFYPSMTPEKATELLTQLREEGSRVC